MEKQVIFYNTHPAIVDSEVFEKVQEIRSQRHRRNKTGKSHMFSGLVYCADCKSRMYYTVPQATMKSVKTISSARLTERTKTIVLHTS